MTTQQWRSLLHLKPSEFKNPDGLHFSVVHALDQFIGHIGSRPTILSDFRKDDPRTHGQGRAIDTFWPGVDSVRIHSQALKFPPFKGVGIYVNETGQVSFHFDTRESTRRDEGPDRWGGVISHPVDSQTGQHVRQTEYVGANIVLDIIKKKEVVLIMGLAFLGFVLYRYISR